MPFITYTTVEGALDDDQKVALSKALTEAVTKTLGDKLKPNVWVSLNETPEGNFYIGGHALKAETLKSLMNDPESKS
jgi:phenylpyruvate tautomerase PptA (4-oxalocrotonate tautomerase family)